MNKWKKIGHLGELPIPVELSRHGAADQHTLANHRWVGPLQKAEESDTIPKVMQNIIHKQEQEIGVRIQQIAFILFVSIQNDFSVPC